MRYLTAQEAAERLEINLNSLYSYVSRGLLSSHPEPGSRVRRYRADEVERLRKRKLHRRRPEAAVAEALSWGSPVLESSLTLIQDGQAYYRGVSVAELARGATFEEVVELLWDGELPAVDWPAGRWQEVWKLADMLPFFASFRLALAAAASGDPAACDLRPAAVRRSGARILKILLRSATRKRPSAGSAARMLQAAWSPRRSSLRVLEAALIVCADHELNTSAFPPRCAASAEANPYAVVSAGLAAFEGVRHGGQTERVEALFAEAERLGAEAALGGRLRRGEPVPGFGHPLYPEGDPRAECLLELIEAPLVSELREAASDLVEERPNLDFALVAVGHALRLPPGAPLALFALGRTAGFLAHALEQYGLSRAIRPRARYTGKSPA